MVSKELFDTLDPESQGYVWYMEAEQVGSPLPKDIPYEKDTKEFKQFVRGTQRAIIVAQDCP